jgi:hypothetical protein
VRARRGARAGCAVCGGDRALSHPAARRGRSLATLTVDDLLQRARPWCVPAAVGPRICGRALRRGGLGASFSEARPQRASSACLARGRTAPSSWARTCLSSWATTCSSRWRASAASCARPHHTPRSRATPAVARFFPTRRPARPAAPRAAPLPESRPDARAERCAPAAWPRRYKHPVALIGILVTSKAWDWLRKQEGGADAAPAVGNAAASPGNVRSPGSPRGGTPRTPGTPGAAALPPPRPSRLQRLKGLAVSVCACPYARCGCMCADTPSVWHAVTWAVMMFSHVVPAMLMAGVLTVIRARPCAHACFSACMRRGANHTSCFVRAVVCFHGLLRNPVPPLRGRRRR